MRLHFLAVSTQDESKKYIIYYFVFLMFFKNKVTFLHRYFFRGSMKLIFLFYAYNNDKS